jgi:LysR family transcriptional regulator, hydrogen peroxide-inducible genes activator
MVAVPRDHPLAGRASISSAELKQQTMLLLGTGHCFRDHVLEVCPEFARFSSDTEGIRKSFEGSSLETIKHMVAAGMGVTVVPQLSIPKAELAASQRARLMATSSAKADAKTRANASSKVATKKIAVTESALDVEETYVRYVPFSGDAPTRRVVLVWRRSFTRYEAIAALRNAVYACDLAGVELLRT